MAVVGVKYAGTCRGGPISGKPLLHPEERFFMFKREGKLITRSQTADQPPDIEVGAYEWDAGQWQWTREVD